MSDAGRVALLDVNVLVALFDPDHVHHELAHDWFADQKAHGWATCPVTEAGFLRVLSNPAYAAPLARPADLLSSLRTFSTSPGHRFWDAAVSLCDESVCDPAFIRGHRQVTDVYLLALACRMGGALATFDRTIPLRAVRGAPAEALQIIEAA
jgi:toxin-antitoxin system PIN domain toxin